MTRSDDELLDQLRRALVDPDLAPGPEELASFHQALTAGRAASHGPVTARGTRLRRTGRASPRLVAVGAVVVAALGAFGGGVAANNLPGPLRTAAYDMGLPVSSPALVAAEAAETRLRTALDDRSRADVVEASAVLRRRLGALTGSDRNKADPAGVQLLAQAAAFLAADRPGSHPPTTENPVQPPETTVPEGSQNGGTSEPSTTEPSTTEPSNSGTESGQSGEAATPESTSTATTAPGGDSTSSTGGDGTSTGGQNTNFGGDTSGTSGDATGGQSSSDSTTTTSLDH